MKSPFELKIKTKRLQTEESKRKDAKGILARTGNESMPGIGGIIMVTDSKNKKKYSKKFMRFGMIQTIRGGIYGDPATAIAYKIANALQVRNADARHSEVIMKNPDGSVKGYINPITREFRAVENSNEKIL